MGFSFTGVGYKFQFSGPAHLVSYLRNLLLMDTARHHPVLSTLPSYGTQESHVPDS